MNRVEARLLATVVPEIPAPPPVVDYVDCVQQMFVTFSCVLEQKGQLFIATDGSVVDTVAAWSVVLDGS